MESKPTILVVGATGAQGGSVARHLLKSGAFKVKGLTRNPGSEKAQALQQQGVEMVAGNLDDKTSLLKALEGCDGVFGVTNFWEHFAGEYEEGIQLIDAVAESGVRQLVMSTLPYIEKITRGQLPVTHFDLKAKLEEHARSKKPDTTFVHLAFYYENFLAFTQLQKAGDGSYFFGFPLGDSPMAAVSVADLGGILLPVFQNPQAYAGKTIEVAGDFLTGHEYAAIMSRVAGKTIRYQYIPRQEYAALGFPGAEEMANMFEFYRLYLPYGKAAVEASRKLYPDLKSFEQKLTEEREVFAQVLK